MRFPIERVGRLAVVLTFLGFAAAVLIYYTTGTAIRVPLVEPVGYKAMVVVKNIDNIVPASLVRMAGVNIGEVRATTLEPDGVHVQIAITDPQVLPLHAGVTVRVGARSVVEDSYLDIVDGHGRALPDGSTIPSTSVIPVVQLDDVLRSFDPKTRTELSGLLRSLGQGTAGTQADLNAMMTGLGELGREGHTALDAIAAQSQDLQSLARQTTVLLKALDTGEGQITTLVSNGQRLTQATAGQHQALAQSIRQLPGVLDSASAATGTIQELSSALAPVAANLKVAAPSLTKALEQLPSTTADLRGLLPALSQTLGLLPATLDRIPTLSNDVQGIIPSADLALRDADPALAYIQPYGPDLAAFFANFNAVLAPKDEAGVHYARLMVHVNGQSVQSPLKPTLGTYYNPLPAPMTGGRPGPFVGVYPHVNRAPQ